MPTHTLNGPAIVGQWYFVPCVRVSVAARTIWMEVNGWVPVIGPKHRDAEYLGFEFEHWHIDWRFVSHTPYKWATEGAGKSPLSRVLTNDSGDRHNPKLTNAPELRRIKCKRPMPDFPVVRKAVIPLYGDAVSGRKWERLERAQAIVCNKLKPGNICPHRGIDLTPFIKEDGTVICPGHGLRWDTKTGLQLPHQEAAW